MPFYKNKLKKYSVSYENNKPKIDKFVREIEKMV